MAVQGLIISSHGRNFIVEADGVNYYSVTQGKKTDCVVGDIVSLQIINKEQAQILEVFSRRNLIYRSDSKRVKIIASNIDQLIIIVAVKPVFNRNLLDSCLIAAEAANITPIIVINKIDLEESNKFIDELCELYQQQLQYMVIKLSALNNYNCDNLIVMLQGKVSLLIGQSGVGKSSITNQIIPRAITRVGDLTKSGISGSHTTTNATLYHINSNTSLIDCPGLQEFGLYHLKIEDLMDYFVELRSYIGKCKFRNCRHLNEPDCSVIKSYEDGILKASRFNYLKNLTLMLQKKTDG